MRIDATHRPWMIVAAAATAVGLLIYVPYAIWTPEPGGGTGIGLGFGVVALGLMLFAALLSVRKRFPIWRIGRAKIWMRAHLWLGLLSLPMVLFHAAFHARGTLTAVLFWLTIIVVVSGVVGAWLQHTLPTKIFREVPFETIYYQIPVIRAQLAAEARGRAVDVKQDLAPATGPGATVVDTLLDIPDLVAETEGFDNFFVEEVEPYLAQEQGQRCALRNREWAHEQFENFRRGFPESAWEPISAIEEICEEKRQLDHQARLHRLLHAWLLVHLPFSAALILLAIIHAIGALRFLTMSIRQRTTKLLARRHDLNYFKRNSRLRVWQWWLAGAALVAAAIWFGGSSFVHGNTVFSAGPMSSSHAVLGQRCEVCHVPVVRQTSWTPSFGMRRKVPDSACLSCHVAPAHHPQETMSTPSCGSCHVEHTGAMHLAAVADKSCTQCHAQLQSKAGVLPVAASIHSFAMDHPEFRALRGTMEKDRSAALALKFNHDEHVKPGLLGPNGKVTLQCADCHVATTGADGRRGERMAPVSFEKSCRSCHTLEFDRHIGKEAPHTTAAEAETFLTTSIRGFAQTHPEVVAEEIRHWPVETVLPEKAVMPPPHTPAEWVTNRIARAETILWREKCALCHREQNTGGPQPEIEPMKQPERWFTSAVFSHPAHQAVECAECHTKTATSGNGSDVLMPSIATCRRCHDGESSPQGPPVKAGHAESGCFLCHVYHGNDAHAAVSGGRKLDELLRQ